MKLVSTLSREGMSPEAFRQLPADIMSCELLCGSARMGPCMGSSWTPSATSTATSWGVWLREMDWELTTPSCCWTMSTQQALRTST